MQRKALLLGINAYRAPITPLRGCLNDVKAIGELLQNAVGFQPADVHVLCDADATRARILAGLDWLVAGAAAGDVLLCHFSGHGSRVEDADGDEWDGYDEILVPYDHDWATPLADDDLKRAFARVPPGVNLTFISDSCHSGTINRVLEPQEIPRVLVAPPAIQDAIARRVAGRNAAFRAFLEDEITRAADGGALPEPGRDLEAFMDDARDRFRQERYPEPASDARSVLLAACQDAETTVDTFAGGDWGGLFTHALVQTLAGGGGGVTYGQLIEAAGRALAGRQQTPRLDCPAGWEELPFCAALPS